MTENKTPAIADDTPFLNGMGREELEARMGEAELRIEEEQGVIEGCKRRLVS